MTEHPTSMTRAPDERVVLTSEEHLNNLPTSSSDLSGAAAAASALRAVVGNVAASLTSANNRTDGETKMQEESKRLSEEGRKIEEAGRPEASSSHTPGPVPQRYWRARKQTYEEFCAEMKAGGLDIAAESRWGRGREIPKLQQGAPPAKPAATTPMLYPPPMGWDSTNPDNLSWGVRWQQYMTGSRGAALEAAE